MLVAASFRLLDFDSSPAGLRVRGAHLSLRSKRDDPLLSKKGIDGNRWQAVANVLFTMRSDRQAVATHGNGFGLITRFLGSEHLPLVATGCARLAPEGLHAIRAKPCVKAGFGASDSCRRAVTTSQIERGSTALRSGERTVSLSRSRLGRLSGLVPVLFACDSARG